MKRLLKILFIAIMLFSFNSCKKDSGQAVVDYSTYQKNYFDVDHSSYVRSKLPSSSPTSSTSPVISNVQGSNFVLTGGSNIISFESSNTISNVIIGLSDIDGYYTVDQTYLTQISSNNYTFSLAVSQTLTLQSMSFRIAYVDINGQISNYYILQASEIKNGTGLLQINCTWKKDNDIDLHVIEPNGEEIYFGNRTSTNGGELDVDSNPNCALDYIESENVTYQHGALVEAGDYTVKVNLYSACNVSSQTVVKVRAIYNGVPLTDANGNSTFNVSFDPSEANYTGKGAGAYAVTVHIRNSQRAPLGVISTPIASVKINSTLLTKKVVFTKDYSTTGKLLQFQFNNNSNQQKNKNLSRSKNL